jgi:hypothetical protein
MGRIEDIMRIHDFRNAFLSPLAALALLTIFGAAVAHAAPGDLDPPFGVGGRVLTDTTTTQFCLPYTTGFNVCRRWRPELGERVSFDLTRNR